MDEADRDHRPPPETILFVEDEPLIRMEMAEFLRQSSYRVSETANAAEAMAALNSKLAIDLVFLDIMMPGDMDGIELAQWIRTNRPGVEVILTSGDAHSKERAARAPELGSFIDKPYTGRALLELVKQALAKLQPPD
jgi:CheY-like chemotaxis protein